MKTRRALSARMTRMGWLSSSWEMARRSNLGSMLRRGVERVVESMHPDGITLYLPLLLLLFLNSILLIAFDAFLQDVIVHNPSGAVDDIEVPSTPPQDPIEAFEGDAEMSELKWDDLALDSLGEVSKKKKLNGWKMGDEKEA
ncbi:hypothetical protein BC829DRAFT_419824 [Chytridium lagenaria]|nr:hypothetical protein BC829DRAFT_419824 [Chytridium lagenaria]